MSLKNRQAGINNRFLYSTFIFILQTIASNHSCQAAIEKVNFKKDCLSCCLMKGIMNVYHMEMREYQLEKLRKREVSW